VIVSALFDDDGLLKGIRVVTDSRPDYRNDITETNLRKRAEAYQFGGLMASRYGIEARRDCKSLAGGEGESAVGELFVKQSCEFADPARGRRIVVQANFYRKPGQSAVNPQLPSQLTDGRSRVQRDWRFFSLTRHRTAHGRVVPSGMVVSEKVAPSSFASYKLAL
jgi:hypothetical protein